MTDTHRATPPSRFDPLPPDPAPNHGVVKVNTVKLGASAGAAVTSAIAASFLGTSGTLIGAAAGAIISTVAGDLYTKSLDRAATKLQITKSMMVQRFPGDSGAATAVASRRGPALEPVDGLDQVPPNSVLAETSVRPTVQPGSTVQPGFTQPNVRTTVDRAKPGWKRMGVFTGIGSFLLALGVVTGIEVVLHHPLSGGSGGTSLSHTVQNVSHNTTNTNPPTPAASETTPEATATESATPTESPSATQAPVVPVSPSATLAPQATATDPQGTATTGTPGADQASAGQSASTGDATGAP
jgi:hypothetical protein